MYVYGTSHLRSHHLTPQSSYNDAMATIRRVPSFEHNFQLVVTRVYEDGDQELLEDEDESESCTCGCAAARLLTYAASR